MLLLILLSFFGSTYSDGVLPGIYMHLTGVLW